MIFLLAACVGPWPAEQYDLAFTPDEFKIGFVHPSPVDDGGWAATHHEGALAAADHFGVQMDFLPLVANIDAPAAIEELIEEGSNVIYTPSTGYITATLDAAANHPDEWFFSCCGQVVSENLKSYFARMYQPLYLAGYTAAATSCTGKLGVVSALPDSEFIRHTNAFALGAQRRAEEDGRTIEVRLEFINDYYNPTAAAAATTRHIESGADVILQQTDSTASLSAEKNTMVDCAGVPSPVRRIAYHNADGCEQADNSENCLGSAHWNWAPLYIQQLETLFAGDLDVQDTSWSPMLDSNESSVNFALGSVVRSTPVLVGEIAQVRQDAVANPLLPFVGPITDTEGTVQIAAGEVVADSEIDRFCWFVDGIRVFDDDNDETPLAEVVALCQNLPEG